MRNVLFVLFFLIIGPVFATQHSLNETWNCKVRVTFDETQTGSLVLIRKGAEIGGSLLIDDGPKYRITGQWTGMSIVFRRTTTDRGDQYFSGVVLQERNDRMHMAGLSAYGPEYSGDWGAYCERSTKSSDTVPSKQ